MRATNSWQGWRHDQQLSERQCGLFPAVHPDGSRKMGEPDNRETVGKLASSYSCRAERVELTDTFDVVGEPLWPGAFSSLENLRASGHAS
ncbi:hypothetical protein HPB50_017191 [Hyalomma asiaticum]|uniref:Uncharacterized protein n=1 Tax=Hyalomma asiaticum TaxID=266040 RepID=A0ACB7TQK6_HYAAI|nr:hypothetical protein HPB50_017191 [Hyalomma asiaticum]